MRLGLVSDIHADPLALSWALAHLKKLGVDRTVACGDLVGYGPLPDLVVELCRRYRVDSARGNHDRWAVERGLEGCDPHGGATPCGESLERLADLPARLNVAGHDRIGLVVHATPTSDLDIVEPRTHSTDDLDELLKRHGVDFLVAGHTHKPSWHRSEHGLVVNPGSVTTLPHVPSSRSFAVIDLERLEVAFHEVETGDRLAVPAWGMEQALPGSRRC
jgi:putative phosphoesterase